MLNGPLRQLIVLNGPLRQLSKSAVGRPSSVARAQFLHLNFYYMAKCTVLGNNMKS